MVFYILKNKDILSSDAFQYFRFKFTVRKIGKTGIHFKSWNTDFFNIVIFMHTGRNKIVIKIDVSDKVLFL